MSQVCVLTDSTAQFPSAAFPGYDLVNIIPFYLAFPGQEPIDSQEVRLSSLPPSARQGNQPAVIPPTAEEFRQIFLTLSRKYREIVTILISSHLSAAIANAQEAASTVRCSAAIHVIDSQTTAVGLGLLVQAATSAALRGLTGGRISRLVRGLSPRIYTVFCVQSLTYLSCAGHLDPAQAYVGEMLGITPFFILENGRLFPIQKARSSRHLVDILHEFVTEFEQLKHIAILQGSPPFEQEVRALRERISGNSKTSFSEHHLAPALAAIVGPRTLGIVVMENRPEEV
jgi:DegV family protein with EDD domain